MECPYVSGLKSQISCAFLSGGLTNHFPKAYGEIKIPQNEHYFFKTSSLSPPV